MTKLKQVEQVPVDFIWPEPLVIEVIAERYPDIASWAERVTLARLQAHALRESYAGRDRAAVAARLELIAFCAPRGIGPERVARVDLVVCRELSQLATTRFRTSPRTSGTVVQRLDAALQRLGGEPRPQQQQAAATAFHAVAAVTG